ncbi:MAG: glycosyltransferase [Prevotella sp.]|nr:glycosyltransferase [Prevotella sp.]
MRIPKIIHQIWSGVDGPLPPFFQRLEETWKRDYPDWEYVLWDFDKMSRFIHEYFPQHWDIFNRFHYNVQRWDAIRYLILYKIGGMYVDFDYESVEPMDELLKDKECCFSMEPDIHSPIKGQLYFNNAMMLCTPGHPFMKKIIFEVFSEKSVQLDWHDKGNCIMQSTGPEKLVSLYNSLTEEEKSQIYLIPARYVTPFDRYQLQRIWQGEESEELESCLEEAYAVHYFTNTWVHNAR